jgi:hypothetical protein
MNRRAGYQADVYPVCRAFDVCVTPELSRFRRARSSPGDTHVSRIAGDQEVSKLGGISLFRCWLCNRSAQFAGLFADHVDRESRRLGGRAEELSWGLARFDGLNREKVRTKPPGFDVAHPIARDPGTKKNCSPRAPLCPLRLPVNVISGCRRDVSVVAPNLRRCSLITLTGSCGGLEDARRTCQAATWFTRWPVTRERKRIALRAPFAPSAPSCERDQRLSLERDR